MITRGKELLKSLATDKKLLSSERVAAAIEYRIACLPTADQPDAWQQLPFLVQFAPLILKYFRDFSLLKRVNPTMRHGGFTEYDKDAIHKYFPAQYRLLDHALLYEDLPTRDTFMQGANAVGYPCMLKANTGERGVGIYYLADEQSMVRLYEQFVAGRLERQPSIIQAYSDLPEEWCLQFYRDPQQGLIVGSLVRRHIPFVTGDGTSTVSSLIDRQPLSLAQREKISSTLAHEEPDILTLIPEIGKTLHVVRKASIDFGTTYEDITPTLDTTQLDQLHTLLSALLCDLPDLCVGRFDLKTASREALLRGEVKIIECNASGGIPTHVYDARLTIEAKYQLLIRHFDRMKTIALSNKQQKKRHGSFFTSSLLGLMSSFYTSMRKKGLDFSLGSEGKLAHVISIYKELFAIMQGP